MTYLSKAEITFGRELLTDPNSANGPIFDPEQLTDKESINTWLAVGIAGQALASLHNPHAFQGIMKSLNGVNGLGDISHKVSQGVPYAELTADEQADLNYRLAQDRVGKKIGAPIRQTMRVIEMQPDRFVRKADDKRLQLEQPALDSKPSQAVDLNPLVKDPFAFEELQETAEDRARTVFDYLSFLTYKHTKGAKLEDAFVARTTDHIRRQLAEGKPLQFSIYNSTEKFPNPLDTRSSDLDFGELEAALELKLLVDNVKAITGQDPTITIVDESPANTHYTNGTTYADKMMTVCTELGIGENVKIVPFGRDFFLNYLEENAGCDREQAELTFDVLFGSLRSVYEGIRRKTINLNTLREHVAQVATTIIEKNGQADLAGGIDFNYLLGEMCERIATNFDVIENVEIPQVAKTEPHAVDPSLLFPGMSAQMWRYATMREELPADMGKQTRELIASIRGSIMDQAALQGLEFKALMRMRYIFQWIFQKPVLDPDIIPLSITNTPNKLSIPMGRNGKSGIILEGEEVRGVTPQHGVGVLVKDKIVCIKWDTIARNPDAFRPGHVTLPGGTVIKGYIYNG